MGFRHITSVGAMLLAALGALAATASSPAPAGDQGSGWTGLTHPQELITARQELMVQLERLMAPVDLATIEPIRDAALLRGNAEAMDAMLRALPHLFPPTTNRYDPKELHPVTLTLPAVWQDFAAFHALANASADAAEALAEAPDEQALRAAARRLRAGCDGCHAGFLRKYEPPKPLASDAEFDFDSALPPK